MAAGVINGTPIHDDNKMYVHARTKFTQIYAVDITVPGIHTAFENEMDNIATRFVEFTKKNDFVNQVIKQNGLVQSKYPVRSQLDIFNIHTDFQISPVTTPNLILVFGIHTEMCVLDHAESIKQRFPHAQILILDDFCESMHNNSDVLFNYCLRSKRIDFVDSSKLVIINEDYEFKKENK